jgi:dipeptidyl aminopeptidase/acylaminoacyl peptidase
VLQDGTLLTTYMSLDFPTELVAVTDNTVKQITYENEHLLGQLDKHETEARMVKTVDGQDMLTWVLYPPKFDASKTYPPLKSAWAALRARFRRAGATAGTIC